MKKQTMKQMIAALAVCTLGVISISSAFAGQDTFQLEMTRKIHKAKLQLQQAEAAKAAERQKLLGEHMKTMQGIMDEVKAMKPKDGMSMKDHEEWIAQHEKLMNQIMDQMMGEHHMLMGMDKGHDHMH